MECDFGQLEEFSVVARKERPRKAIEYAHAVAIQDDQYVTELLRDITRDIALNHQSDLLGKS